MSTSNPEHVAASTRPAVATDFGPPPRRVMPPTQPTTKRAPEARTLRAQQDRDRARDLAERAVTAAEDGRVPPGELADVYARAAEVYVAVAAAEAPFTQR